MPPAVPREFTVRLGQGWGTSLEDLVEEMESHELGAGAAAAILLSWLEFVELEGVKGCRDLVERPRLPRGAAGRRQGTGGAWPG